MGKKKNILKKNFISDQSGLRYIVYNNGTVYDINNSEFLSVSKNNSGYSYVSLELDGKYTREAIHRLVAISFVPNPKGKPTVNHIDGNKDNNWDWNLEWLTVAENNKHAYDTGLHKPIGGEDVHFAKYTEKQVRLACELMQDGKTVLETESLTGIPSKTLYEIRLKQIWKSISKDYEFPEFKYPCMPGFDPFKREEIDKLVLEGKKPREIVNKLGLSDDWKTYKKVADAKYRLLKAQRSSANQANGLS